MYGSSMPISQCATINVPEARLLTVKPWDKSQLKAIEKANTTDKEAVRNAIESLKGVVGTAGIFNFSPEDHNGLDLSSFVMLTVKKGKFALLWK